MRYTISLVAIVIVLMSLVFIGVDYLVEGSCETKANDMSFEYRYSPLAGCRIKTKQGWIPLENYRQEERR